MQLVGVAAVAAEIAREIAEAVADHPDWSRSDFFRPTAIIAERHTPDYVEVRVGADPSSQHGIVITMTMPMSAEGLIVDMRDGNFAHLQLAA